MISHIHFHTNMSSLKTIKTFSYRKMQLMTRQKNMNVVEIAGNSPHQMRDRNSSSYISLPPFALLTKSFDLYFHGFRTP